jgi:Protein of unknown function (DUF2442)
MSNGPDYPRIASVEALSGFQLRVAFVNGQARLYDFTTKSGLPGTELLRDEALFKCARVDVGGYGIVWNDDLDIAESELWLNGQPFTSSAPAHT